MTKSKNRFGYDNYIPHTNDETYERPKTTTISEKTKAALRELGEIFTWAQFVEVCRRQQDRRERLPGDTDHREWWRSFGSDPL